MLVQVDLEACCDKSLKVEPRRPPRKISLQRK